MKTKNHRPKSRPTRTPTRRSPRVSGRSARALPVLHSQDAFPGQSDSTHKIFHLETSRGNESNDDNGGEVPDSIHNTVENDSRLSPQMGTNSGDFVDSGSLDKGACFRCKARDDQVLVCCEIGCLTFVHEKCLGCGPAFDDLGNFYCPVCEQRRALAAFLEMRSKVKAAKKALLNFLESEVVGGGNKQKECDARDQRNEAVRQTGAGVGIHRNDQFMSNGVEVQKFRDAQEDQPQEMRDERLCCHDIGENVGCSVEGTAARIKSLQGASVTKETSDKEDGENEQEKDSEPTHDREDEGDAEDKMEREDFYACHGAEERIVNGAVDGSKEEADISILRKNQGIEEEEEQRQPEASEELENSDDVSETESLARQDRRLKQRAGKAVRLQVQDVSPVRSSPRLRKALTRPKRPATRHALIFDEKATNSNKSKESAKPLPIVNFPNAKRKRLRWTPEEEEMLREGVNEFSIMANSNLPWKKILEFGRHIFDSSRTPTDLKDKWRKLAAK